MNTSTVEKPRWAGEDWLSKIVNVLIATRPIYSLMKRQARQVLIKTAEKKGIAWRNSFSEIDRAKVQALVSEVQQQTVCYPDYYQQPFHAYDEGNLCWQAAFEAEPATYAMGLRIWPEENLSWQQAHARLRSSFHQVLAKYGPSHVQKILDMGCSVGISTRSLHHFYSDRQAAPVITHGLDLSPYMLAVAAFRDPARQIQAWHHAAAEDTGFPDNSFDLITLQFVIHELPQRATRAIFTEIYRILKPGGCLGIVDNNPKSPVIQNLPPVLFTLMKSTEPWTDEYYTLDVEALLKSVGFVDVRTEVSDPRHRSMLGFKR